MVAQVLSVVGGGVHEGEVIASDIEQHPYLKEQARRAIARLARRLFRTCGRI